MYDLRAWHVAGPIEALGLVPSDYQDILLVNHYDFALGDLAIIDFERGPAEGLKVIERVLVKLCEVEQLLRETVGLARLRNTLIEELF